MKKPAITRDSVVLVSGGGRGITATCVKQLAKEYPCRYILLGRSPLDEGNSNLAELPKSDSALKQILMDRMIKQGIKPAPQTVEKQFRQIRAQQEISATLNDLSVSGAQTEYLPVDISKSEELRVALKNVTDHVGPVTGIIHGAGTLADKRIEKKTVQDFNSVVSPKVDGLRNLLTCVSPQNLDFLVLFSSIVGVFGNIGQADYAIANEVLNKTAYQVKRENPQCRVLSINWGPWDSGMVTPELAAAFAERNMPVIPASVGAETMVRLLTDHAVSEEEPIQIVVGSLPTRPPVQVDGDLHTYLVSRRLLLEKNPFLVDHVIGENPVLPATCAASWVASTSEQLYPGYLFSRIEDFNVLKGIVFDNTLPHEHNLELKEVEKTPEGRIRFEALITSKSKKNKPVFHYSLKVELERKAGPPPNHTFALQELTRDQNPIPGDRLYQNGTLFHGPSFQGVQKILHFSKGRMVLECNLPAIPPEKQGQFLMQTTNPFIYDAIVQSILIWSQRYYEAPCLPSHLERLEHYQAIPFNRNCLVDVQITSHASTYVLADIWVTDTQGNVYVKFKQLKGTISPLLNRLIGKKTNDSD